MAPNPALHLRVREQGAGVRYSARDRGRSHARAQRDGGKEVAHLVCVAATTTGVAQAQLAVLVVSCSHGPQDKQSGFRPPAKVWPTAQTSPGPKQPSISTIRGSSHAVALRPSHVHSKGRPGESVFERDARERARVRERQGRRRKRRGRECESERGE